MDKSFVKGTMTKEFLDEARSKVNEILANSSSPPNDIIEIENEVFNNLMYEEEIPKRPIGFGLGLNSSSVFGVHGMLRQVGYSCSNKSQLEVTLGNSVKENQDLRKRNERLESKFEGDHEILMKLLTVVQNDNGRIPDEFVSIARSALCKSKSQVPNESSDFEAHNGQEIDADNGFKSGGESGSQGGTH